MNRRQRNCKFDVFRGEEPFLVSTLCNGLEGGRVSDLKIILERTDANPNEIQPQLGVSPLHLAIGNESENFAEEVTRLFLQYGGNPNVRSVDGETPVHIAAAWGRANLLKLLLINGGNPWICDEGNNNAFHLAFWQKHWKVIELLRTFHLENLEQEDSNQQKYIMTLDKVHLYNKNIVIEYDQAPRDNSFLNSKRSVATQTNKDTLIGDNDSYLRKETCFRKQSVNDQVFRVHEIPVVENNLKIMKNESSQTNVRDECTCGKMQKDITNVQNKLNRYSKYDTVFPDKSVKDKLLEELKKFHAEKNKARLNLDKDTIVTGGVNLTRSSKIADENDTLHTSDSSTKCNNSEIQKVLDNNVIISDEKICQDGNPEVDDDRSFEILNTSKSPYINLYNLENILKKDDREEKNVTSKTQETEVACSSSELLEILDLTDDFCYEEEWTASHSCFTLLDDSDYRTCDDDVPLLADPDIETIRAPQERKENLKYCTTQQIQHDSLTSTSSSGESFVSVTEEYKYSDVEEGVVLLEKRFLVPPISISCLQSKQRKTSEDRSDDKILDESISSDSSSVPSSLDYDTDVLRNRLQERGFVPGPIIPSTKKLYLRKLMRLQKNPMRISTESKVYSPELQRTLADFAWNKWLVEYLKLEKEVVEQFAQPEPGRCWREGNIKSSFTYLLLDPRITENLPCRVETLSKLQVWSLFLSAIFYIGKGKRSRPYSHLYQAFTVWNKKITNTQDKKVQYILDIWSAGMGVVCLHVYQNVIPVEAYTREAAMIDALGLRNLKNVRCGEYYGVASTWTSHQKRMLGTFLLYRAMLIFLQEGERQLRPGDIGLES